MNEVPKSNVKGLHGKTVVRAFQFRSSSDASVLYTTLLYSDGTASCNCPGWTRRVGTDNSRTCKHVVAAGISPVSVSVLSATKAQPKVTAGAKHAISAVPTMKVVRKFSFDED